MRNDWKAFAINLQTGVSILASPSRRVRHERGEGVYHLKCNYRLFNHLGEAAVETMPYGNAGREPIILETIGWGTGSGFILYTHAGVWIEKYESQADAAKKALKMMRFMPKATGKEYENRKANYLKRGEREEAAREEIRKASREMMIKAHEKQKRAMIEAAKAEILEEQRIEQERAKFADKYGSW